MTQCQKWENEIKLSACRMNKRTSGFMFNSRRNDELEKCHSACLTDYILQQQQSNKQKHAVEN